MSQMIGVCTKCGCAIHVGETYTAESTGPHEWQMTHRQCPAPQLMPTLHHSYIDSRSVAWSYGTGASTARSITPAFKSEPPFSPPKPEKSTQLIEGYRRWLINRTWPDGVTLQPLYARRCDWSPRQAMKAECQAVRIYEWKQPDKHPAPDWQCQCGIYLEKDQIALELEDEDPCYAYGTCYGWGKIIEHERGYRCEYAYPNRLMVFDNEGLAKQLESAYGVPCEVWES